MEEHWIAVGFDDGDCDGDGDGGGDEAMVGAAGSDPGLAADAGDADERRGVKGADLQRHVGDDAGGLPAAVAALSRPRGGAAGHR